MFCMSYRSIFTGIRKTNRGTKLQQYYSLSTFNCVQTDPLWFVILQIVAIHYPPNGYIALAAKGDARGHNVTSVIQCHSLNGGNTKMMVCGQGGSDVDFGPPIINQEA